MTTEPDTTKTKTRHSILLTQSATIQLLLTSRREPLIYASPASPSPERWSAPLLDRMVPAISSSTMTAWIRLEKLSNQSSQVTQSETASTPIRQDCVRSISVKQHALLTILSELYKGRLRVLPPA